MHATKSGDKHREAAVTPPIQGLLGNRKTVEREKRRSRRRRKRKKKTHDALAFALRLCIISAAENRRTVRLAGGWEGLPQCLFFPRKMSSLQDPLVKKCLLAACCCYFIGRLLSINTYCNSKYSNSGQTNGKGLPQAHLRSTANLPLITPSTQH